MFEGAERVRVETEGAIINALRRGEGPQVLPLLSGSLHPLAMWRLVAPRLAEVDRRPSEEGVALYCHCSIKEREVGSNGARCYLDCGGLAHRGCVA
jgi:hypothetical protein